MRFPLLLCGLLLAGTAGPASAQSISGRLLDAGSGQPIQGGTMVLLSDGTAVQSVVTDTAGRFLLRAPNAGSFRLRAERIGYRTAETAPLDLAADDTLRVEFRLSVDAVELNPITVIGYSQRPAGELGGFHDRARMGFGQFVTREEIDRRMPLRTSDLLRAIPGVTLAPAARGGGMVVRVRGDCVPRVYLDGVPIGGAFSIDDLVLPADLEGIEVYRGPAEIPAQFARNACGVLLLWTRRGG